MADVFPVIPEELPAQVAESIGRSPAFVFHEDGRSGSFQLIDGALWSSGRALRRSSSGLS